MNAENAKGGNEEKKEGKKKLHTNFFLRPLFFLFFFFTFVLTFVAADARRVVWDMKQKRICGDQPCWSRP
jgi:hypothetical protein